MNRTIALLVPVALVIAISLGSLPAYAAAGAIGVFEGQAEVGSPGKAGSATFDETTQTYTVSGGGANMWAKRDDFHFVWKRVSGDVSLAANVAFPKPGGNAHRKACLVIRQSLDPDSAYADVAVHGDGLTSLQCRAVAGGVTNEVQSNMKAPGRVAIERQGYRVFISVASCDCDPPHHAGGSFKLELKEPFYVGLGVCAHDDAATETATFMNVDVSAMLPQPPAPNAKPEVESTLETVSIASKDRRVVYWTPGRIEAPNWAHDGTALLYNSRGQMFRVARDGAVDPVRINTGPADRCNNDHGLSPDGKWLAISSQHEPDRKSRIYVLPDEGGEPKQLTSTGPSYWHGWSPDGKTIVFCGERNGEFDVYAMPAAGGAEVRLTTAKGLDDGPEFSPDGRYVYFNSDRTGSMQIWRMRPDGSDQQQVTSDNYNNWFPHPSPDGKWLLFLSYLPGVQGHPADQDVQLRLMPLAGNGNGGPVQVLASVFGGQGTINVPCWSPDSKHVAFVSYLLVRP